MHRLLILAALPALGLVGTALACPYGQQASRPMVMADNAATSTPAPTAGKPADAVAYPNSPNGSPMTSAKGAPVVTDKAACGSTSSPSAGCEQSPPPSSKADTSDTAIGTPTTVNAKPAAP